MPTEPEKKGTHSPDTAKTDLEKVAELQKQVVELTARATQAEAKAGKLEAENISLRGQNHELFIRATRVQSGLPAEPEEEKEALPLDEAGKNYFAAMRKTKGRYN